MTTYPTEAEWAAAVADQAVRTLSAMDGLPPGVRVVYDHTPLTLTPKRSPVTNPAEVPVVFVDTETDGVHPGRRPWEVALLRRNPDGSEISYQAFLDIDLSTADPFGLKVGRFYDRHPLGRFLSGLGPAPKIFDVEYPEMAAVEIARLTHGAYVIGAVPWFDTVVFEQMARSAKLTPSWHYHLIDVETLAAGQLGIRPPWDFDTLLGEYGLTYDEGQRHTAMGDVTMAAGLYDAVMARGDRRRAEREAQYARELFPDAS